MMCAKEEDFILQKLVKVFVLILSVIILHGLFLVTVLASTGKNEVPGKVYEFDKDSHYEFSDEDQFAETGDDNTYGVFSVSGNISDVGNKDDVPAYEVADGNLSLFYKYGDTLLNADVDSWHLIDDKSKNVDSLSFDDNILKGVIILQTSNDRLTWVDEEVIIDAFSDIPVRTEAIYSTTDVQLINGCYYRIIIAYEVCIRTEDSNFLFINTDKYDYKKYAEVYEFYAYTDSGEENVADSDQTYSLGDKVRTENFDGYSGEKDIDGDDIHYGWDLGKFFVSGYTDEVVGTDGRVAFLKNVGDRVTLWFNLNQNINALDQKNNLMITADTEGYDEYFETPKMDFGRGVLIVRYTDYNNVKAEPTIYTNYLEANATVGADTKVQLFEEGDYEVALDYEVTSDELIDKVGHYRIFFRFSVRNGNCMVYPFDVVTGDELTNSSMTESGFRLDLAKSRYLNVNIKREILKDSADGLVEDTRFNGPAKEGTEYTEEGIYTITVHNQYTNQSTVKKIYVGTNDVLRAYMTTGLAIPEINKLVERGAVISEDGTIDAASSVQSIEQKEKTDVSKTDDAVSMEQEESEKHGIRLSNPVIAMMIGVVCVVAILMLIFKWCKTKQAKQGSQAEGGTDQ